MAGTNGHSGQVRPVGAYLTPAQAAGRLGVSCETIYRWVATGRLKGYKLAGGRVLVAPEDLPQVIRPVVPEPGG